MVGLGTKKKYTQTRTRTHSQNENDKYKSRNEIFLSCTKLADTCLTACRLMACSSNTKRDVKLKEIILTRTNTRTHSAENFFFLFLSATHAH